MSDDSYECRVTTWANYVQPYWDNPNVFYVRVNNTHLLMLIVDGLMARVDGGDPGDEQQ